MQSIRPYLSQEVLIFFNDASNWLELFYFGKMSLFWPLRVKENQTNHDSTYLGKHATFSFTFLLFLYWSYIKYRNSSHMLGGHGAMETIDGLNTGTTKVIVDKFVCTNLVACLWTHLMSRRTLNNLIVSIILRWIIFFFKGHLWFYLWSMTLQW